MERLAFFGDNKQINLFENGTVKQLTYPLVEGDSAPSLWPTWSSDGQWIAYFQPLQEMAPARLCIAQVNGMEMMVLAEMRDRQPIYIHWSPTGHHLAVVEQSQHGLQLIVYPVNGSDPIVLDDGAPIFFQWLENGTGIVAHVVHPIHRTSRIQFYSLEESTTDWVISEDSGGFCTPLFQDGKLLYAEQIGGLTHVKRMSLDTEEAETLCALEGVLSLHPRPFHNSLAIGVTGPQPTLKKGVQLMDLDTGELKPITTDSDERLSWQSMFWTPDGSKLLLSAVNGAQRWLEWQLWTEAKGHEVINQFLPTREQLFFLHFFDQFAVSHSIVSTDSEHFYFSAYESPHQRVEFPPRPWLFRGVLEAGSEFRALEHGLFPAVDRIRPSTV